VTAAIFGLLGVIVGGLVTGGVSYVLEARRERKELRRARRLVWAEIDVIRIQLRLLAETGRVPLEGVRDTPDRFLPSLEWSQHKSILAAELSDEAWVDVSSLYDALVPVKLVLMAREPGSELLTDEPQDMHDLQDAAAAAQAVLDRPPSD
jgi:hypothetical protein